MTPIRAKFFDVRGNLVYIRLMPCPVRVGEIMNFRDDKNWEITSVGWNVGRDALDTEDIEMFVAMERMKV